jgi:integrase
MCRMLLILLYGSGLRIGEALHLTLRDIDLIERIVTVRHTKFFKTRLVPIGPKLGQELAAYIQRRRDLPLPLGDDSRLFTTKTGRGWPYSHVNTLFHHVRREAGIVCAAECLPPRIHDIRHTFAVRALEACKGGRDEIARHMLALSTYLGHAHPSDTYYYLQATPKLMEEMALAGEALFRGGST